MGLAVKEICKDRHVVGVQTQTVVEQAKVERKRGPVDSFKRKAVIELHARKIKDDTILDNEIYF